MKKKICVLLCMQLLVCSVLFAFGKKEVETKSPEDPESWSESFDVAEKRGKYNVIVTAEDIAGNEGQAGAFNMYIDPNSDLPVVAISNPTKNMTITGQLSASGTCFDDDGVDHILVMLDEGEPVQASGTEFWSYVFDTALLSEGLHKISVWGVDINGVEGKVVSTEFYLSQHNPETRVLNIEQGAFISGKKELSGVVSDENGVAALYYSTDDRKTFTPVSLRKNKKEHTASFSFWVDTKTMEEGPSLFWFKAVDTLGAEGLSTFLCIIDNTPPNLQVLYPPEGEVCDSVFAIGGKASDTVGIASLSWRMGSESGTMDIVKGNTYWVKEFDTRNSSRSSEIIEIIATDVAGNNSQVLRTVSIDHTHNVPVLQVLSPAHGEVSDGNVFLAGTLPSNSGSAEIRYQIDYGNETSVLTDANVFGIKISDIPAGDHKLTLYAVNAKGIKSASITIPFSSTKNNVAVPAAKMPDASLGDNAENEQSEESAAPVVAASVAAPVISLNVPDAPLFIKGDFTISGKVSADAGFESLVCTVGNREPEMLLQSFSKMVSVSDMEDGPILVAFHAVDKTGQKSSEYRILYKDTVAPVVDMVLPAEGDKVNGTILTAFSVQENSLLGKAEYKSSAKDSEWQPLEIHTLVSGYVGSSSQPIDKDMQFRFTDRAGNQTYYNNYLFEIDTEADKPVAEVHFPLENQVITKDFMLSGMIYDDDGVSKLYYTIDNGTEQMLEIKDSFSVPLKLTDFTDNEHIISVYGEDIYGVKSSIVKRKIRISLERPSGSLISPTSGKMVRDRITISGKAEDKNGIASVSISIDNGNSYNFATGTADWSYDVDTKIVNDGTHVIFAKITDNYGQENIISSLLNIDNTPPLLNFKYPVAGGVYDNVLRVAGNMLDNMYLDDVVVKIKPLSGQTVPAKFDTISLSNKLLVSENIDVVDLAEGRYNFEITAIDKAKNVSNLSRNFAIERSKNQEKLSLLYPLNGETVVGEFNVYGRITATNYPKSAALYIDGAEFGSSDVSPTGYFSFRLTKEDITEGSHELTVKTSLSLNKETVSLPLSIAYKPVGPWVTIDNFAMGDFAIERPYLRGTAGYSLSEEEEALFYDKNTDKKIVEAIAAKKLTALEISFDNGKTFSSLRTRSKWKYRLETESMAEGMHYILVKATMANRESAVSRTIVYVDKTAPVVELLTPNAWKTYNEKIVYAGLVSDNVELANVKLSLRRGDKYLYSVPGFLQGLHFDVGAIGATIWNAGIGLSFFEHSVKLQLHYGMILDPQWSKITNAGKDRYMRYGGHVVSMKILANIFDLPFKRFAGPDWAWLHMTGALGASFSIFTQNQSGRPQVLAAMLAQLEFPRVKLPKKKVKYFNTFSFYTEGQLWFIPTDVKSSNSAIKSVIPRISIGLRAWVF